MIQRTTVQDTHGHVDLKRQAGWIICTRYRFQIDVRELSSQTQVPLARAQRSPSDSPSTWLWVSSSDEYVLVLLLRVRILVVWWVLTDLTSARTSGSTRYLLVRVAITLIGVTLPFLLGGKPRATSTYLGR